MDYTCELAIFYSNHTTHHPPTHTYLSMSVCPTTTHPFFLSPPPGPAITLSSQKNDPTEAELLCAAATGLVRGGETDEEANRQGGDTPYIQSRCLHAPSPFPSPPPFRHKFAAMHDTQYIIELETALQHTHTQPCATYTRRFQQ